MTEQTGVRDKLSKANPDSPGIKVSLDFDLDEQAFVALLVTYVDGRISERGRKVFDRVAERNLAGGEAPSDAVVDALVQACVFEVMMGKALRPSRGISQEPA